MATTWTTTLAYSTEEIMNYLPISQSVPCLSLWESASLVYLVIYGYCSQLLLCHRTCVCICLNHKLWTTWADFCICPHAIKLCLPHIYPWRHTRDQMYRALPLLSRESLGVRLSFVHRATKQASWCNISCSINCYCNKGCIMVRLSCLLDLTTRQLCTTCILGNGIIGNWKTNM